MLDKYSSIPTEFLLEGFDVILDRLRDMDDYAKFAISETASLMTTVTKSVKEVTDGIGSAFSDDSGVISKSSSAVLQVGGELSYAASALGANLKLTIGGDGNRIVENDNISNWTESLRDKVEGIVDDNVGGGIAAALDTIVDVKNKANDFVDNSIGDSIEAVENAKRKVEDIIKNVKDIFENLTKDFGDSFGFVNGNSLYDNSVDSGVSDGVSNINSTVAGGVVEITKEVTNFVKNFNIGKVVTSIGGIAVGAGTDVAIDAADIVLMKNTLLDVPAAITLSKKTLRNIKQNLFWAFIYNIICIPLAAGCLFLPFGIILNPMIGAAAMSLSSFCVVTNSLRLNFAKIY
jgi:Cu2+-exporting ATPase